ncbi:MAG: tRNA pseudouridine(38-40) synthase TruA [Pelagibacteraceae bacterium TMED237]|nr:MAG: tRNA pseudouridine(38-40) synthase TruA [Pelagibacteraceae bacterium TMED237]|tara:strand:+ start:7168 stop:7902 length:735 start_codon:yes stop_codon:yes gene_type:complete
MHNYKIIIEYDGTNFVGWQRQDNGISIQQLIEDAILKLTNKKIIIYGAGRTDAGVHAKGQVASFELENFIDTDTIRDGLNHHLRPHPVAILSTEKTDNDFNARFSAKLRCYEYKVISRRPPLTLQSNRVWCVHKTINVNKVIEQSKFFLGKHDLSAFRSINCQSKSAIKSINSIDVKKNEQEINFIISAKSFLHSQVRIMVGTLVDIGLGKISKSISEIITLKKREYAGVTAPPHGLYLTKVEY